MTKIKRDVKHFNLPKSTASFFIDPSKGKIVGFFWAGADSGAIALLLGSEP